jgi:hypothetical protein
LERAAKNSRRSLNTEIVERLEQSFRREDFEKLQDAINGGMLKVMAVVADVARQMPPSAPRFGLLDLLTPEQTAQVFERPISTDKEEQSKWGEWPKSTDKEEQSK